MASDQHACPRAGGCQKTGGIEQLKHVAPATSTVSLSRGGRGQGAGRGHIQEVPRKAALTPWGSRPPPGGLWANGRTQGGTSPSSLDRRWQHQQGDLARCVLGCRGSLCCPALPGGAPTAAGLGQPTLGAGCLGPGWALQSVDMQLLPVLEGSQTIFADTCPFSFHTSPKGMGRGPGNGFSLKP